MKVLGIVGFFVGGVLGLALPPSFGVYQLHWMHVLTRGATLPARGPLGRAAGEIDLANARASFDIMLVAACIGALVGVLLAHFLFKQVRQMIHEAVKENRVPHPVDRA